MKTNKFNQGMLVISAIGLGFGFGNSKYWLFVGFVGLIPALIWFFQNLFHKAMGSDLLAVFSLLGSILTEEFFAAAVISVMLSSGRVLESWAQGQAERRLVDLLNRLPRIAHRFSNVGSIQEIRIADILIGDRLLVRSGEITPTDGNLLMTATLDESALTGEPLPLIRAIGEHVTSGSLNAGAPFEYISTTTAENSTFAGIIKLVKSAQAKSSPGVHLANKWAVRFVPVALVLALAAWAISGDITRAVAVLVAATPCPLILAVPIAIVAGLSHAARNGAVIKNGGTLELLAQSQTVLLDKTGTITSGGPAIAVILPAPGGSENNILQLAASVDQYSPHIVAKTLVQEAKNRELSIFTCTEVHEIPGIEISANLNGSRIRVGQMKGNAPAWVNFIKPLMVTVTRDDKIIGVIGLEDPIREESKQLVSDLLSAGVTRIALVTGDREETAREVAASVGISEVFAKVTAQQKLEITQEAKKRSVGSVIFVGDGVNDAPALAIADVGVAMGARGASAASEAADVVIVEDSIDRLTIAITIAKTSRNKAIQAAGIGMGLSFIAMIAGALGVISPSQGAVTQEIIDVIAIMWALTALAD